MLILLFARLIKNEVRLGYRKVKVVVDHAIVVIIGSFIGSEF